MLDTYPGGLNAYEIAYMAKKRYPAVACDVKAIRTVLTALHKDEIVTIGGKEDCTTCFTAQTFYRLRRGYKLSID
jgi:hypothetical protein